METRNPEALLSPHARRGVGSSWMTVSHKDIQVLAVGVESRPGGGVYIRAKGSEGT